MRQRYSVDKRLFGWVAVAFAVICGLLILVPFNPAMPGLEMDRAWPAATNAAVAQGLAFGRDFIFTSGPYSSIYTRVYAPSTDASMLLGSLYLAVVILAAAILCVPTDKRAWLFGLPILLAMPGINDAVLLCAPWLLVLFVAHGRRQPRWLWLVVLHALVAGCALLPLIKGSAALSAFVCVAIAAIMVAGTTRTHAILVPVTFGAALLAAWCAMGQSPGNLPVYFASQREIIAGYTDAMSRPIPLGELACVALASTLLLIAALRVNIKQRWFVWAASALTLFIGVKAGMTRSGHTTMTTATIFVVSAYLVFALRSRVWRVVVLAALGLSIAANVGVVPMSPEMVLRRTIGAITNSARMGVDRLRGGVALRAKYRDAVKIINTYLPVPADGRTADIYTVAASAVIFSGEKWTPRPVIQSYSAYTPELVRRNVDHLAHGGPDRVYWEVHSIDGRYASLDDGASWRWLLGGYRLAGRTADHLVLENTGHPMELPLGPEILSGRRSIGDPIDLPTDSPLWVNITLRPTFAGKLRSLLFKSSDVHLIVVYPDHTEDFSVVPGMMETGFLLSPTIGWTSELQSLLVDGFGATPPSRVPVRIGLEVPGGSGWIEDRFDISIHKLAIPRAAPGPGFFDKMDMTNESFDRGGDCAFDPQDGTTPGGNVLPSQGDIVALRGVAAMDVRRGIASDETFLLLVDADGARRLVHTRLLPRPDLAAQMGSSLLDAGFNTAFRLDGLKRPVQASVIVSTHGKRFECPSQALTLN